MEGASWSPAALGGTGAALGRVGTALGGAGAGARGDPVGFELRCGIAGDRALEVERQIPPCGLAAHADEVLRSDVSASRPEPFAVGNHHLAMVAQVARPLGSARQQGAEDLCLDTHRFEFDEKLARQLDRANAVKQQPHGHAALDASPHAAHRIETEGIIAEDVRADIQSKAGALNGLE